MQSKKPNEPAASTPAHGFSPASSLLSPHPLSARRLGFVSFTTGNGPPPVSSATSDMGKVSGLPYSRIGVESHPAHLFLSHDEETREASQARGGNRKTRRCRWQQSVATMRRSWPEDLRWPQSEDHQSMSYPPWPLPRSWLYSPSLGSHYSFPDATGRPGRSSERGPGPIGLVQRVNTLHRAHVPSSTTAFKSEAMASDDISYVALAGDVAIYINKQAHVLGGYLIGRPC